MCFKGLYLEECNTNCNHETENDFLRNNLYSANTCWVCIISVCKFGAAILDVHGKKWLSGVYRTVHELGIQAFSEQNPEKFAELFRMKWGTFNHFS